jgi:hypothetical protein
MVRSMGCFVSTLKANSKGLIFVAKFYGVVAKFHQTQMVTPILMIVADIITKIVIQYPIHFFRLSIALSMENNVKL